MAVVLISLGSNLGERHTILDRAVTLLQADPRLEVRCHSRWLETSPVGGPSGQPPFLNGALLLQTDLSPRELLKTLLGFESQLGRERQERWGARTIDLDILLYDQLVVHEESLQIPHPRMAFRHFNLAPAAEIAGELLHPVTGWTVQRLLDHLFASDRYVAVTGPLGTSSRDLLQRVQQNCPADRPVKLIHDPLALDEQASLASDLSGLPQASAIELVNKRAAALRRDKFDSSEQQPAGMVLGDFWLGETENNAEAAKQDGVAMASSADGRHPESLNPRLIVLLDCDWQQACESLEGLQPAIEERIWQLHREHIMQALQRPNVGPVLKLSAQDPELAYVELTAAIEAISPPE